MPVAARKKIPGVTAGFIIPCEKSSEKFARALATWPALCERGYPGESPGDSRENGAAPGHGYGHRACVGAAPNFLFRVENTARQDSGGLKDGGESKPGGRRPVLARAPGARGCTAC